MVYNHHLQPSSDQSLTALRWQRRATRRRGATLGAFIMHSVWHGGGTDELND